MNSYIYFHSLLELLELLSNFIANMFWKKWKNNSLLCPCCSPSGTQLLHIAFVMYKSTSYGMNHFIPLFSEVQTSKCL